MKTLPSYTVPVLWLLSFFFSMPLVEPYEISRLLALASAVLALGVVLLEPAHRAAPMPRSGLAVLVAAFFLWCGFTYFWSVSPFVTLVAWGTLSLLPLWFLIFALMPISAAQVKLALRLCVAGGVALSLWALVQFAVLTNYLDENGAVMHPFADPNNFAALLNMAFFVALGLLFNATAPRERVLMMAGCAVMVLAMLVIGSRAGLLLGGATLVLFLLLTRSANLQMMNKRGALVLALVLGGAVLAGLMLAASVEAERVTILSRMGYFLTPADGSGSIRMMLYAATLDLIKQYPWAGAGLGTFAQLYPAVRAPAENISSGLMAHSDPLQFWAEAGLPTLLLLYAVLCTVAWRFIKFLRATPAHNPARIMPVALFCALLTLALHMHVSFHLFVATPLVVTGLLLGVWARLNVLPSHKTAAEAMPEIRPEPILAGPVGMVALIAGACLLVVFQTCLFSEMYTRQAVRAMERGDMALFGDKINQANREGFGLNPRPYILAASIPLELLQTSPRLPAAEKQALFDQTNDLLDRGLARAPLHAGAYFSKAMLYSAVGRKTEAHEFIDKTLALDPRHPQAQKWQKR